MEGTPVRFTGQDCERGTFSHRHALLSDYQTGGKWNILSSMPAPFLIKNTMLSELACLGFEYGYSTVDPRTLVLWEAQFGDFVNGAQQILDQFLSSGESKWNRMSGLVLLLPHGYEGQGPEHSSARLERFLQLCAENNLQVCYPSNPAQYFHMLRRQMHRKFRKPLILMMPKSLLRDEKASSKLSDFTDDKLHLVLQDPHVEDPNSIQRILLCSGKVYYTLNTAREDLNGKEMKNTKTAIVRIEQLYPFPKDELLTVLSNYPKAKECLWVQEEPKNMAAWNFIEPRLREILPRPLNIRYCGRGEAASPAHGMYKIHYAEEKEFVTTALGSEKQDSSAPPLKEHHGH
jgi:2-oxoglutarate dehydrogenase E1 component